MEDICLNNFFRDASKSIRIHLATEAIQDPYEKNTEFTEVAVIPIKAIVTDISPASAVWKMPGIIFERAKEIIIKKKYENLLKQSYKIEIDNEYYYGWRINGRLNYRIEGDFLRVLIYIKQETI